MYSESKGEPILKNLVSFSTIYKEDLYEEETLMELLPKKTSSCNHKYP